MLTVDIDDLWPKENHSFYDIKDENYKVNVKWTKKYDCDYFSLASDFFICAHKVCENVVDSNHNIVKSDMWFLPCAYMFRQAIELGLKSLICSSAKSNSDAMTSFQTNKHNLIALFDTYITSGDNYLSREELIWLTLYLVDLENVDKQSALFRFPFQDNFLSQYRDMFLCIADMGNNLIQCFSLVVKCISKGVSSTLTEFDKEREPKFLQFSTHGVGNCHLWESLTGDGFHKQVVGYSEVAEYLFYECGDISNEQKAFPLMFLLRNSIELGLKRMFYKSISFRVPRHIFISKRNSHLLYKDLWKYTRPLIEHYAQVSGQDFEVISIVEKHINELSSIDKNGDLFRYPTNYSLEYTFNNKDIDLLNVYKFMQSIFYFLNSCEYVFSEIEEFEAEARAEMAQYADYDYY